MLALKTISQPKSRLVTAAAEQLGHYEEVANEIGFMPPPLLEKLLINFMSQHGLALYDNDEVDVYLAAIAEKEGKSWVWRPLREQDEKRASLIYGREAKGPDPDYPHSQKSYRHGSYDPRSVWHRGPYEKAVPLSILRHVMLLHKRFGEHVHFFVSDYAVVNPDPFIMVTAPGVSHYIFGVWDEPGFGLDADT